MSAAVVTDDPLPISAPVAPTGRPRLFPASATAVLLNYLSAAALLLIGVAFYSSIPYYHTYFTPVGLAAIRWVALGYLIVLPVFYATFPDDYAVKCRLFWRAVLNLPRRRPTEREAVALRAVAVKMFYLPMMTAVLASYLTYFTDLLGDPGSLSFYTTVYATLLLIDLCFFTLGYAVEHPWLGNEIRSVEPTLLGWLAALACYFPLQPLMAGAIGWYQGHHPEGIENPLLLSATALVLLVFLGIYTWASVSLGFKASNLTNRGTVTHGPYAYIRHPAYLGKLVFWWGTCIAVLGGRAAAGDWSTFALIGLSLSAWSGVYVIRALTEERHLSRDPDYRAYRERVRYRFIPGVW
jgi:protein-S-isoprenylcysteine O-methyltransferase Ste14